MPYTTKDADTNISRMYVEKMISESGISIAQAVRTMNADHPFHQTSPQNISNKMKRDTLYFSDMLYLAEAFGYTINFELKDVKTSNAVEEKYAAPFEELLLNGFDSCPGINFANIVVAGEKAEEAVYWIKERQQADMTPAQEALLLSIAKRNFDVDCKFIVEPQ